MENKIKTYHIPATTGSFAVTGYFLTCRECRRKILVEIALLGTNHNATVTAICAECLKIGENFKKEQPKVSEQIEEWQKL